MQYADELAKEPEGKFRLLVAKPTAVNYENSCTVRYALSLRHRGRTLTKKEWCHHWCEGVLIKKTPRKRQFPVDEDIEKKV